MENIAVKAVEIGGATKDLTPTTRVAAWSVRHRRWMLAVTVLVLVAAMFVAGVARAKLEDECDRRRRVL